MNAELIKLIETLLGFALQYGPQLAGQVQVALGLLRQPGPVTDEQMEQINLAFDRVHAELMSAIIDRAQVSQIPVVLGTSPQ